MDWETPKAVRSFSRVSHLGGPSGASVTSTELTRKQIETELEVLKLKEQVEKLGGSCRKQSPNWNQVSVLEEENEELKTCLQDAESRLLELQKEHSSFESKCEKEALILKAKVEGLKEANEVLKAEKAKIKSNYDKTSKTLSGLKSYLKDVPSVDEFNEVKASLTTKEALVRDLYSQLDTKILTLEHIQTKLSESEKKIEEIQTDKEELSLKLNTSEDKLKQHFARLENSRQVNPEATEVLLEKNATLEVENDRLKKYVQYLKSKSKKELGEKDGILQESKTRIERMCEELSAVNEQSIKYRETIDLLRGSLKDLQAKHEAASKRIKILEDELSLSESSSERSKEINELVLKLVEELSVCLREIDALSLLSRQVVAGEDPNISLLLGFERLSSKEQNEEENSEDSLITLQSQLVEIKKIKREISEMRQILADKYAESLGNNMTSCITQ